MVRQKSAFFIEKLSKPMFRYALSWVSAKWKYIQVPVFKSMWRLVMFAILG